LEVGVALSSGGAASLAQIGALEVLLEAGVPIDVVAGTSAGAIIGAVFASGRLAEFRDAFATFTWRRTLRLFRPMWRRGGLLEFGGALEFTRGFVVERIEDLDRRFAAVAVDLATGDEIAIRSGDVVEAIAASCAIPGIFRPYLSEGRWLADGALVNPIPVSIARKLGAGFTIAINVLLTDESHVVRFARACRAPARRSLSQQFLSRLRRRKHAEAVAAVGSGEIAVLPSVPTDLRMIDVLAHATRIVQCQIAAARLQQEPPDAIIHIPVGDTGTFDLHRGTDLIAIGRKAAEAALPEIERALAASPIKGFLRRFVERVQPAAVG